MQSRVRGGETVRHKVSRQRTQCFPIVLLEGRGMRDQHGVVILGSPGQKRSYEGDADASSLVSEKLGKTRSFVVFVFTQEAICELPHPHKQRSDTKPLKPSEAGNVLIISAGLNTGRA